MKRTFLLLGLAALVLAACTHGNPVLTVEGGKIQGVPCETPGITVFKGIPFAAPPVGELRWKAPQPVIPWEGVRVCDTWGAPSWQPAHTPADYTEEFFFDGDPEFSEDCLNLNVWTPAAGDPSAKLPVTLWIHGGAFIAGWGFEPEMDGEEWAKHGGVLVSCNYRLGFLGFLAHPLLSAESPEGVSGNYGIMDQIAALKWVKNNIAAFGGDPDRVTIMGQSAGAMSVKCLASSPLSRDLISGAIIQSGGGITEQVLLGGATLAQAEASGKILMDLAGYDTIEKMREATPQSLIGIGAWLAPVIDGYVLTEDFSTAAVSGSIADVPYMIGSTLDDMPMLASGIDTFCQEREKAGGKAWSYQFARRLPTDGRPNVLVGAFHSSELWYMFKSLRLSWRPFTPGDYALAEEMITRWTNFAATGNPNGTGPETWTPCTASSPTSWIFKLDPDDTVSSGMGMPLEP